ncbi:uncharacterized protein LOC105847522 isoform X2 [Hydra vulgaris]|uniref:uncharacterized protein LOC105847522 isoform X2 n=1 Tax=Hydra vulgaris TaxID=6087 RepID=UPI001F5E8811|nr:uncharacterized protein LOC105847522 isoform X2 [Hydra vulgaris]
MSFKTDSLEPLSLSYQEYTDNNCLGDFYSTKNISKNENKHALQITNFKNILKDNNNELELSLLLHNNDYNNTREFIGNSISDTNNINLDDNEPDSTDILSVKKANDGICKPDAVDESFIRSLIEAAYKEDENEISKKNLKPRAMSSPNREKIYIRELSYDELKDMDDFDLMAPVYLAVTDEGADNLQDLKRASKSIENLCSATLENERSWEDELKSRKSSNESVVDNLSSYKNCCESILSDAYNESIDDSLEDQAFIEVLKNHTSFDDDSGVTYHSASSLDEPKDINVPSCVEEELGMGLRNGFAFQKLCSDNEKMSTFWEYSYEQSNSENSDTTFVVDTFNNKSINTSPESAFNIRGERFVIVNIAGQHRVVDLQLIEQYVKLISHGGDHYVNDERRVIIVINAYHLPKANIENYRIIMEQLFYYCIHAVTLLVIDTYEIVFFNSNVSAEQRPNRDWIKNVYSFIQYRFRKQLKKVYFVHPSLWLKAMIKFCSLFVSSKFMKKIRIIRNLQTLRKYIPTEYIFISPEIQKVDKMFC